MKHLKTRTKVIVGIIAVGIWISFINWADSTLPETDSVARIQTSEPANLCASLRIEKDKLESEGKELANEAFNLQSEMMRARLSEIASNQTLTKSKSDILNEYLSYDMTKLIEEKSDVFGESFKRHMELRPMVIKIVDQLIKQNVLQPRYFPEIQTLGDELRVKFADARIIVSSNKDCFKFTAEVDEMIDDATQKINNGVTYNGWTAVHSAEELVDSMR